MARVLRRTLTGIKTERDLRRALLLSQVNEQPGLCILNDLHAEHS